MLERARAPERLEQLEHRALLRRARKGLLPVGQCRQILAEPDDTVRLSSWLRPRRAAERGRQSGPQSQSDGNYIIIRHPPAEIDHLPAQGGGVVRNLDDPLDLLSGTDPFADPEADADLAPVSKRDDHARARNGSTIEIPSGGVGERLEERDRQRHFNQSRGWGGHGPLARSAARRSLLADSDALDAESRARRQPERAAGDRRPREGILSEKGGAVEIRVIEKRRELRDSRYAKARLDHASRHHDHAVRARRVNDPQCFAKAAAFGEL